MAFSERKIAAWTNPVSAESDRPRRTAAEMKAIFDSNSNQLKAALNGLVDDLLSPSAAGLIGSEPIDRVSGTTVREQILGLKAYVDDLGLTAGELVSVNGKTGKHITLVPADIGAANAPLAFTVTLLAQDWQGNGPFTQTVTAEGTREDAIVDVAAHPSSYLVWCDCCVRATHQAENALTFAAERKPETDLIACVRVTP